MFMQLLPQTLKQLFCLGLSVFRLRVGFEGHRRSFGKFGARGLEGVGA